MTAGKKYWDVMYTLRPSTFFDFFDPKIVPSAAWDNSRGQKSLGPLKMSLEMAHKVIVPQKKLCPAVS